jgi:pyruvate kinase
VELRLANLKACKGRHSVFVGAADGAPTVEAAALQNVRGVLLDTRGPEIRTGKLADDASGHATVTFATGDVVTLCTDDAARDGGSTAARLYVDYPRLADCLAPGAKVLLDDGAVVLTVTAADAARGEVTCAADNAGELRSRAGVNLPGAATDLPAMSAKDRVDIRYGMTKDVDYVAASFVQNAAGVREIRAYLAECAAELADEGLRAPGRPLPLVIRCVQLHNAIQLHCATSG